MSTNTSSRLLRHAIPLVAVHGFTREALALAACALPGAGANAAPLPDAAVTALFGRGDAARRTLVRAWLAEGRAAMRRGAEAEAGAGSPPVEAALRARLRWNEPALAHLPEAFALLASPPAGLPPLDPRPALEHAASVADEACHIARDTATGTAWYVRRAALAAIYSAAELHQLTSSATAPAFLADLLAGARSLEAAADGTVDFATYVGRSWLGIVRSLGVP